MIINVSMRLILITSYHFDVNKSGQGLVIEKIPEQKIHIKATLFSLSFCVSTYKAVISIVNLQASYRLHDCVVLLPCCKMYLKTHPCEELAIMFGLAIYR